MKASYLVILPLLALAACSNKSSNDAGQGPLVPPNLGFTKPAAGPSLTPAQVAEMKATLKSKSTMALPPGELVFPGDNTNPADIQRQEEQLRMTDPNSYALMQDMRKNCDKGHQNVKFDATFPTENITGENVFDVLQKGDQVSASSNIALTNIADCPVDLGLSGGAGAEVKDINARERSGSVGGNTSGKFQFVMKNPKYAQLLGARGILIDSNISGVVVHREVNGPSSEGMISYKVSGSYLSLKADIPYNIEIKALGRENSEKGASSETTFTATFKYPTFIATLVGHTVFTEDGKLSKEFYLNGNPVTEEELAKIFGDQMPGAATQQTMKAML